MCILKGTLCRKWRKCLVCRRLPGPLQEQEMGINKFLCLWESSGWALFSRWWSSAFGAIVGSQLSFTLEWKIHKELNWKRSVYFEAYSCFSYFISISMKYFAERENYPFFTICSLCIACHLNIYEKWSKCTWHSSSCKRIAISACTINSEETMDFLTIYSIKHSRGKSLSSRAVAWILSVLYQPESGLLLPVVAYRPVLLMILGVQQLPARCHKRRNSPEQASCICRKKNG